MKRSSGGKLSWNAGPNSNLQWTPWEQETEEMDSSMSEDGNTIETDSCFVMDFTSEFWHPVPCLTSTFSFICKQKAG